MPNSPFSDPALQWVSINDFTPGIKRWARAGGGYPTTYRTAPIGSAATAFRCCAKPDIGLIPFADWSQLLAQTHTATDASNPVCLSMGNMMTLAARGGAFGDLVTAILIQTGHPEVKTEFRVTRLPLFGATLPPGWTNPPYVPYTMYSSNTTTPTGPSPGYAWPFNTTSWPMMDYASWQDPTSKLYARTVITTDPISTSLNTTGGSGHWVSVRGHLTPTIGSAQEVSSGNFTLMNSIGSYPRIFYHANRMGIWQVGAAQTATNGFISSDNDVLFTSDLLSPTNIQNAGTFFPEMGTGIGAWGSISTGEFVGIYQEGGAILIYGDLGNGVDVGPTQVIKLPGVIGTLNCSGKAVMCSIGMVYATGYEGAYVWNGDNTSTKISEGVPETDFVRTHQGQGFLTSPVAQTSMALMQPYIFFPNNWIYDTSTSSWWQCEDPAIKNFQVFCGIDAFHMFASEGIAYAAAGATATLNTYTFNKANSVQSYVWISNPIPVTTEALVSIQLVELFASNMTPTPCTVTLTPTVPASILPFQNQNGNQSVTFTIPPLTEGYRASQKLGYTDYNVQIRIDATNTNVNQGAPIIHAVNLGYTQTRTAGIGSSA